MAGRGRAVGGGAGGGRRSGAAPTGGGRAGGAPNAEPLYVLAVGDGLIRPCVDCGRQTGNFCETLLQAGHAYWQGGVCLAADWMPQEEWADGQRTPLCTSCEERYGACRFCRGVQTCTPPSWGRAGPAPEAGPPGFDRRGPAAEGPRERDVAPGPETQPTVPHSDVGQGAGLALAGARAARAARGRAGDAAATAGGTNGAGVAAGLAGGPAGGDNGAAPAPAFGALAVASVAPGGSLAGAAAVAPAPPSGAAAAAATGASPAAAPAPPAALAPAGAPLEDSQLQVKDGSDRLARSFHCSASGGVWVLQQGWASRFAAQGLQEYTVCGGRGWWAWSEDLRSEGWYCSCGQYLGPTVGGKPDPGGRGGADETRSAWAASSSSGVPGSVPQGSSGSGGEADMPVAAASSSGEGPSASARGHGAAPGGPALRAEQHEEDAALGTGGGSGFAGVDPPSPPPAAQGP